MIKTLLFRILHLQLLLQNTKGPLVEEKPDKYLHILQGVPKKGIDKKLLFGAAEGLNLQFLN